MIGIHYLSPSYLFQSLADKDLASKSIRCIAAAGLWLMLAQDRPWSLRGDNRSGGTTAPAIRPLRRYDRSGDTTAPAIRPLRRYDRSGGEHCSKTERKIHVNQDLL